MKSTGIAFYVSILSLLLVTLLVILTGNVQLSVAAYFFLGIDLTIAFGLSFLVWSSPAGMAIYRNALYSSLILFLVSAIILVFSFLLPNSVSILYLGLTLQSFASGTLVFGVSRGSRQVRTDLELAGFSVMKSRLYGILLGIGIVLTFLSYSLSSTVKQVSWTIPLVVGFVLIVSSFFGWALEVKKWLDARKSNPH